MADKNQIIVYGASDDCIEIEGAVSEEYSIYGDPTVGTVVLESPDGETLEVTLEYRNDWQITLPPVGEHLTNLVPWPVKFGDRPDRPEDPALFIDAPAGTTVRLK